MAMFSKKKAEKKPSPPVPPSEAAIRGAQKSAPPQGREGAKVGTEEAGGDATLQSSKTEAGGGSSNGQSNTPPPKKTVSQVLGEVTWLLTQSPVHKQLFIGDLEWFIMPPLLLEQFRIFNGPQHPVGVALWARVSEDTDKRLREGAFKLRMDEWKGGSIPWLIELIAPFGGHDEIMADFSAAIFPTEAFNFHRVDPNGQRVVASFQPQPKS